MLGRRDGGTAPVGATDRGQATLLRRSPDDVKEGSKNKVKDETPSEGNMALSSRWRRGLRHGSRNIPFAAKGNNKGSEGSLMSLVFHPPPSHTRGAAHGTMKLLTHNLLQSPGTRHGYPLAIEAEKVETVETEFNPDFLVRMVEKLDYPGLVTTIATVCHRRTAPPRAHAACA